MASFLPTREPELVTWSGNFATLITATPTAFGLVAGDATAFNTVNTAWVNAYNAARSDTTRTPSAIATKNAAKKAMIAEARLLARKVQATPTVTAAQKLDLGLNPRDVVPTPVPPPSTSPNVDVVSVVGRVVKLKLHDSTSGSRRGRPVGAIGAAVFSYVGTTAPTEQSQWHFEGNTRLTTVDVVLPDSVAGGAQVFFCAFWYNRRSESGPPCAAVTTYLQGGSALAEAA